VRLPSADWTAPVAESTYDWRVEVLFSDMMVSFLLACFGFGKIVRVLSVVVV
jgi:hypothetical protein